MTVQSAGQHQALQGYDPKDRGQHQAHARTHAHTQTRDWVVVLFNHPALLGHQDRSGQSPRERGIALLT